MTKTGLPVLWILSVLILGGCHSTTRPSELLSAQLVIEGSPNPSHVGDRPTLTMRETAGVGVAAQEMTYRTYSTTGELVSTDPATGADAWFLCNNTPQPQLQHLEAYGTCTLLQATRRSAFQYEFDFVVQDDNGHRLTFHSPRFVTLP
jgi:hypothetical protein